jgi:hypothetical protein
MRQIKRQDIVDYFENDVGGWHGWNQGSYPLSFNVKLNGGADGRTWQGQAIDVEGSFNNPELDDLWETVMEADHYLDSMILEHMRESLDLWFSEGPEFPQDIKFDYVGRSGGNLVISEFEGWSLHNFDYQDFIEMDYSDLWDLFKVVKELERILPNRNAEYAYQLAWHRASWEAESAQDDYSKAIVEALTDLSDGGYIDLPGNGYAERVNGHFIVDTTDNDDPGNDTPLTLGEAVDKLVSLVFK